MLGNSLRTPAVAWASRRFVRRVHAFITGGAELNGTSADDALATAFISSKCDQSNTGWVGPSLPFAIKRALESEQHPGDVGAHVRADEDKLFH